MGAHDRVRIGQREGRNEKSARGANLVVRGLGRGVEKMRERGRERKRKKEKKKQRPRCGLQP